MAISVETRTKIVELTVGMVGAAPGAAILSELSDAVDKGLSLSNLAIAIANNPAFKTIYPSFLTNAEFANNFINALMGSEASAANKTAAADAMIAQLNAGTHRGAAMYNSITALAATAETDVNYGAAAAALNNKTEVAVHYSVTTQQSATTLGQLQSVVASVTSSEASVTAAKATVDGTANAGLTLVGTTGADNFTGFTANDTFNFTQVAGGATWTVGDSVNGGAGNDIFNVTQTAAITTPTSATVVAVETANLVSGTTGNSVDTTSWTGLTALNATGVTAQTYTVGSGTAVTVVGTTATGATTINGGTNVTLTETGATGGTVSIGATTAPSGTVSVTSTGLPAGGATGNAITVKGGTTVSVTQKGGNPVNTTNTDGAVVVTGTASTTAVTVTNDKAATASATVVGHVNGAVTIDDVNKTSTTTAGVIQTVTLASFAAATINSGALKTINASGTGTTLDMSTLGALTTPANNTLQVNLTGLTTTGAVTIDNDITALNVNSATANSTLASLVANGVAAITVTGDKGLTLTATTLGALTSVNASANSGGVVITPALANGITFTGGSGADAVSLGATTKAITMGAGNDTVTYGGAAGVGGSVNAGDGDDIIVMSGAEADAADNDSTFNTKFTNFEVLSVETGATETLDMVGLGNMKMLRTVGANGLNFTNLATGGTLTLTGASTTVTATIRDAAFNTADTFNLAFSNLGTTAFGTVIVPNTETVSINVGGSSLVAAGTHTLTLQATGAKTVTVTGASGLTLTNTGNTAITSFDASGVVGNNSTDTAAALAVTFVSANTTGTASVTIIGGAGNDTLTGVGAKDTITGGAGNDIISGGAAQDTANVGSGRDIVAFTTFAGVSTDSSVATADVINGFGLVETAIAAVDLSNNANFQGAALATGGGANVTLLNIDADSDGANTDQPITLAGATAGAAGVAVGVTAVVSSGGRLTLTGAGAAAVDTLGEWVAEANGANVANAVGEIVMFNFGSDTYVFVENGTADLLIQLVGVTGTSLVEVSAATTAAAGAVLYADVA